MVILRDDIPINLLSVSYFPETVESVVRMTASESIFQLRSRTVSSHFSWLSLNSIVTEYDRRDLYGNVQDLAETFREESKIMASS